jgi:hypothetical protein
LYGQGGADKLFGGPSLDYLTGGPGNDALNGGDNLDHYHFVDGWGKDSITDEATSQNGLVFIEGPGLGESAPATADLTIKLISGEGPEVKNASDTSTVNWEGNVIKEVYPGSGDDQITGNSAANVIDVRSGGADTISTGGGNDTINVLDGSGDDVVDCGETLFNSSDNDTVYFDSGDQIAAKCENPIAQP